jgi:Tfp pilus assembly protein PilO
MNKQILALFIPILALAIPVAAVIFSGMHKMAKLRLEETRLRLQGGDSVQAEELNSLRNEVDAMRSELSELQERVDFAERLLASPPAIDQDPRRN